MQRVSPNRFIHLSIMQKGGIHKIFNLLLFFFFFKKKREVLLYPNFTILNSNALNVSLNNIVEIYDLDSTIHQVTITFKILLFELLKDHLVNVLILNSKYVNAFNQIMMLDPCTVLASEKVVSQADCESFADGSISQVLF